MSSNGNHTQENATTEPAATIVPNGTPEPATTAASQRPANDNKEVKEPHMDEENPEPEDPVWSSVYLKPMPELDADVLAGFKQNFPEYTGDLEWVPEETAEDKMAHLRNFVALGLLSSWCPETKSFTMTAVPDSLNFLATVATALTKPSMTTANRFSLIAGLMSDPSFETVHVASAKEIAEAQKEIIRGSDSESESENDEADDETIIGGGSLQREATSIC